MQADLGLVGCKLGPIYQDVDPLGPEFLRVCEALERLELPLLIHQGTTFLARTGSPLVARPILLDEVALRFPELRIVIAHMGHPWFDEAIAVVRRHPHVYADVPASSATLAALQRARAGGRVPRRAQAPLRTDFPFFTARETIDGLRAVTGEAFGAEAFVIDPDVVEAIIQRPSARAPRDRRLVVEVVLEVVLEVVELLDASTLRQLDEPHERRSTTPATIDAASSTSSSEIRRCVTKRRRSSRAPSRAPPPPRSARGGRVGEAGAGDVDEDDVVSTCSGSR